MEKWKDRQVHKDSPESIQEAELKVRSLWGHQQQPQRNNEHKLSQGKSGSNKENIQGMLRMWGVVACDPGTERK